MIWVHVMRVVPPRLPVSIPNPVPERGREQHKLEAGLDEAPQEVERCAAAVGAPPPASARCPALLQPLQQHQGLAQGGADSDQLHFLPAVQAVGRRGDGRGCGKQGGLGLAERAERPKP